ncbi:MAG: TM2 domain-containing protein [Clostridia bacterium]|nr:TM2 domain-containing protein [Clostridia bacterium]
MNSKQMRKAYGILALIAAGLAFVCALYGVIHGFTYYDYYYHEYPMVGFGGAQVFFLILSVAAIVVISILLSSKNYKNNKAMVAVGLPTVIIGMVPVILALVSYMISDGAGTELFAISIIGMIINPSCMFIYFGLGVYNLDAPHREKRKEEKEKDKERLYEMAREAAAESARVEKDDAKNEAFFLIFKEYFPEDKLFLIRKAFAKREEDMYTLTSMLSLKNPQTVLLYSIFLGGIAMDRFYIGDIGMGVAKIFLNLCTFGIFSIVDIFFCYKKAKEKNLTELLNATYRV